MALAVVSAGLWILYRALRRAPTVVRKTDDGRIVAPTGLLPGERQRRTVLLVLAAALFCLGLGGRHVVGLLRPSDPGSIAHEAATVRKIRSANGVELAVQEQGLAGKPRLIFTHGWGLDHREWNWAREQLAQDFHVITWDLPGL
ncbi:MAG: hypothetical protein WKF37_08120 [Bryobacteraceae bacterium]